MKTKLNTRADVEYNEDIDENKDIGIVDFQNEVWYC